MKKNNNYFLILFSFFLLISCGSDDSPDNGPEVVPPQTKDISFSFDVAEISNKDAHKNKGVNETLLNKVIVDAASVVITIQDESNTIIYNREKLDLTKVNDTYISSLISLDFGSYTITEFIVLDAQDNAIYLTPKDGSDMASNVTEALPISLTIGTSSDEQVTFKVLDTNNLTADDFGYVSFDFEILNYYSLEMSATIYNSDTGSFEYTDGVYTIKGDGENILSGSLNTQADTYSILKGYTEYTIEIEKEGYITEIKDFTGGELDLETTKLTILLLDADEFDKRFTLVTDQTQELKEVSIHFDSSGDTEYKIDWGDGNVESYAADYTKISHTYVEPGIYNINAIGDMSHTLQLAAPESNIIDASYLPGSLEVLNLGDNLLSNIDLSANLIDLYLYNNKFSSIDVSSLEVLRHLNLRENQLQSIDVSACTTLKNLVVPDNPLTSLDVSSNHQLEILNFVNVPITSLDVSSNPLLKKLWGANNHLNSIDVSHNPMLESIQLSNNQITTIDVSANTELTYLGIDRNQIGSIDLTSNTKLTGLALSNNQLTSLNISNQNYLKDIYLYVNSLDVASLEHVYMKVHDNAIQNNITEGDLLTYANTNVEANENIINYANTLVNSYQWAVQY